MQFFRNILCISLLFTPSVLRADAPSAKTPGSPQLDSFGPDMTLASELLKKGERDVVIEYFGLCRSFWKLGVTQLDAWTETVRKGETPIFLSNLR